MAAKFKSCSVHDCNGNADMSAHGRMGMCSRHYQKSMKYGDPLAGKFAKAERGEALEFYDQVVRHYDKDECLIWPYGSHKNGYAKTTMNGRKVTVSRVLCEEVNGPPPTPKHQAAHTCGRGANGCVTRSHLVWKTRKENEADKLLHGTHNRGERHPKAKLDESQVREILRLKGHFTQEVIGRMFGVHQITVSQIHTGKTWAWLA